MNERKRVALRKHRMKRRTLREKRRWERAPSVRLVVPAARGEGTP